MNLHTLFSNLKNYLAQSNLTLHDIIRAEQGGKKPNYPYAVYKITSQNVGNYLIRKPKDNPDPTKYSETYFRKQHINISFSLLNKEFENLYKIAHACYDYLDVVSKDFQKENKIRIEILNNIDDRTIYLEPEYEYRVGFDFRIHLIGKLEFTLDAVDIEETIKEIQYEE